MEAKLVYIDGDEKVVLCEGSLQKIDKFTCDTFKDVSDIFSYEPYQKQLDSLSKNGQFFVSYSNTDVPMESIDFYATLGKNPFDSEQMLSVFVGDDNVTITENGLIEFTRSKLDTLSKVIQLKEECVDFFKSGELLMFGFAEACGDYNSCVKTLEDVFDRECGKEDSYFFRRLVVDRVKEVSGKQDSFGDKIIK